MKFGQQIAHPSIKYLLIGGLIVGALMVALLAATLIYARGRESELKRLKQLHALLVANSSADHIPFNESLPLHEQVERLPYDASIEIKLERLITTRVLSSGEYGRVYAGELLSKNCRGHIMEVAVKGPRDAAKYEHMKALVDELRILIAIGTHPNVLGLVGAVTKNMRKFVSLRWFLLLNRFSFFHPIHNFRQSSILNSLKCFCTYVKLLCKIKELVSKLQCLQKITLNYLIND
ncbi:unnamed protein product [Toxocara canis]|uniref:Protein kinase domain-containing protein n=1 Tax=Toxocara canis TaxID=6265 RepID=A0A183U5I9_TOXCA|nr:unnamed protein product [Toxocara canis]